MTRPLALVPAATAVGSLPHTDAEDAVDLVLAAHPQLPAAPRLPLRDRREGRMAQAAIGIAGLGRGPDGQMQVDLELLDPATIAEDPFPIDVWEGLHAFLDRIGDSERSVKLQLTGPLTLGLGMIDAGCPTDIAFPAALAAVRARATALAQLVDERTPNLAALVVLDEPGLTRWSPTDFPLDYGGIVDLLSTALASLSPAFRTGVHCCDATDWSLLFAAGPDVVSLPMDVGVEEHPAALAGFLEAGGWVAWGAVPVDRPVADESSLLFRRLSMVWCELSGAGCEPDLIRCQALVTPACGLSRHSEQQAEVVLGLAATLAERVQDQAVAARLALGA